MSPLDPLDPLEVEFLFDFGSPNAYLAHRVIPEIEVRTGARFEYVPILLGGVFKLTGNASPAVTMTPIKNRFEYETLEMRRFIELHGLQTFTMNPHFPVNTLPLMRGATFARRQPFFAAYVDVVFRAMWEAELDLGDPDVFRRTLETGGLDADAVIAGVREPDIKAELIASTESAVERGVFGAPSFFVDGELFFGKDRLEQVEAEILTRRPGARDESE
ncbi:MAG: 2-hydroxychromene-2-carboxylate isomerase [Candidatus Binatia bacterium]